MGIKWINLREMLPVKFGEFPQDSPSGVSLEILPDEN